MDVAAILVESYAIDAIWSIATVICFVLVPSIAFVLMESWIQIKAGLFITRPASKVLTDFAFI